MAKYAGFFHGSGVSIDEFSFEFTGQGNDQLGSGFYFTSDPVQALRYATVRDSSDAPKLGGEGEPTVHEVVISALKLLPHDKLAKMTRSQARAFAARAPLKEEAMTNWGDVDYEGRAKVFNDMVDAYVYDEPICLLKKLHEISNDLYGDDIKSFNHAVKRILGYDGVIEEFKPQGDEPGIVHICAFFPEQIKIVARTPAEQFKQMLVQRDSDGAVVAVEAAADDSHSFVMPRQSA